MNEKPRSGYAQVRGLKMYYELHGSGRPLVLLHGAFGMVEAWGTVLPTLAKHYQVIIAEMQGHGRTADIDRPFTSEDMADDTAALLKELKIEKADVFGYSMGGQIGLALAIRHPGVVDRLAIIGATAGPMKDTYERDMYQQFLSITPENFNIPQMIDPYTKVAPNPDKWPDLVRKIREAGITYQGYTPEQMKGITAPVLVMMGDREGIRIEHAVEMRRLIPNSQLAIFPTADHFLLYTGPDKVLGTLLPFLEETQRS